jgi:ectoine hydroxylase-related dioxygenase (phytanoyl-CoA dioxygenase family)
MRNLIDVDHLHRRYAEDGFCVTPPIFAADAIAAASAAAEAVAAGESDTGLTPRLREREAGDDNQQLVKVAEPHNASRTLRRLLADPEPWRLIAAVTGARLLQIWAVDLFIKRPERSAKANIGWHQDGPFAPYWKGDIFTAWLALSSVSADDSPLRYVRGSHRLGPFDRTDLFHTDLDPRSTGLRLPDDFEWMETVAEVPAGAVALHHRDTLHASGPNLSARSRQSLAIRLRTDGCTIEGNVRQIAHLHDPELAPVVYDER